VQLPVLIPVTGSPLKISGFFMVSLTDLFSASDRTETPTLMWKIGKDCYSGAENNTMHNNIIYIIHIMLIYVTYKLIKPKW